MNFLTTRDKFLRENDCPETRQSIQQIKERCLPVLEENLRPVTSRVPSARNTFHNLSKLSPTAVLRQLSKPACLELFLSLAEEDLSKIEEHLENCHLYTSERKRFPRIVCLLS